MSIWSASHVVLFTCGDEGGSEEKSKVLVCNWLLRPLGLWGAEMRICGLMVNAYKRQQPGLRAIREGGLKCWKEATPQ